MIIRYPKRLRLARTPTPIEFMPRLTDSLGGPRIYFKRDDLTGAAVGGNKIRKLEFSLAEALSQSTDVVITAGGVQSNHCRATALACAQLGIGCHLILRGAPDGLPDGNLLLDRIAGAAVSFFPREVYAARKMEIVAQLTEAYARKGKRVYWIPVGASNAIGSWGYVRAFAEIASQADRAGIRVRHIVTAVGSGGTAAGLIAGRALLGRRTPDIWGVNVCDDAPTFEREIRAILEEMNERFGVRLKPASTPIRILDGYVGAGYAVPYPEEMELLRLTGEIEGQILDPVYTGKALHGLREEIRRGRFAKRDAVLFVHTGGIFGIFPQRAEFGFPHSADKPALDDF
jgi:D-cysteine desulfhydrase